MTLHGCKRKVRWRGRLRVQLDRRVMQCQSCHAFLAVLCGWQHSIHASMWHMHSSDNVGWLESAVHIVVILNYTPSLRDTTIEIRFKRHHRPIQAEVLKRLHHSANIRREVRAWCVTWRRWHDILQRSRYSWKYCKCQYRSKFRLIMSKKRQLWWIMSLYESLCSGAIYNA